MQLFWFSASFFLYFILFLILSVFFKGGRHIINTHKSYRHAVAAAYPHLDFAPEKLGTIYFFILSHNYNLLQDLCF